MDELEVVPIASFNKMRSKAFRKEMKPVAVIVLLLVIIFEFINLVLVLHVTLYMYFCYVIKCIIHDKRCQISRGKSESCHSSIRTALFLVSLCFKSGRSDHSFFKDHRELARREKPIFSSSNADFRQSNKKTSQ